LTPATFATQKSILQPARHQGGARRPPRHDSTRREISTLSDNRKFAPVTAGSVQNMEQIPPVIWELLLDVGILQLA
jgi:hypothetical protein